MKAGAELEPGWPCSGPLLRLAEDAARRLLPAFNTTTGMPYGTVNLRHGVPKGETPVTCTAGVGTFLLEFGTLSRLTGDPIFEETAMRAMNALWARRSQLNMVGNHIDVQTGAWTAVDAGIGAGVDSYLEYLVKGGMMFYKPELLEQFEEYVAAYEQHSRRDDWYFWVNMAKGQVTLPIFQSLEAFWPGLKSLYGDVDDAMKTLHNYYQVWQQFGFTPEFYNVPRNEPMKGREGYPLRPELAESVMYLYKATGDPFLLDVAVQIVESLEHSCRTRCGYAVVKDSTSHAVVDRMESFFLAETTKYLYLIFDSDNFVHNTGSSGVVIDTPSGECIVDAGGYFFNTEAHLIDVAALDCCSASVSPNVLATRVQSSTSPASASISSGADSLLPDVAASADAAIVITASNSEASDGTTGSDSEIRNAATATSVLSELNDSADSNRLVPADVDRQTAPSGRPPLDLSPDSSLKEDGIKAVSEVPAASSPDPGNISNVENQNATHDAPQQDSLGVTVKNGKANLLGQSPWKDRAYARHKSHLRNWVCPVRSFASRFALFGEVVSGSV